MTHGSALPLESVSRSLTLDALHLASCAYLVDQGQEVELASYDRRMNDVARAMDIPLFDPEGP